MSSILIIDSDEDVLKRLAKVYDGIGLNVETFRYPEDIDYFVDKSSKCDFILVEQKLGGTNGANVAHNLMKDHRVSAKILIFSKSINENYRDFIFYRSESELLKNPHIIYDIEDNVIEQAVETSVLMQMGH
jgi:DNA-binding NtrC family response regulator